MYKHSLSFNLVLSLLVPALVARDEDAPAPKRRALSQARRPSASCLQRGRGYQPTNQLRLASACARTQPLVPNGKRLPPGSFLRISDVVAVRSLKPLLSALRMFHAA